MAVDEPILDVLDKEKVLSMTEIGVKSLIYYSDIVFNSRRKETLHLKISNEQDQSLGPGAWLY